MKDMLKVFLRPIIYIISFCVPKSKKYVLVGGWNGRRYADNSRAIFEYLDEHKNELGIKKVFWYTKDIEIYNSLLEQGKDVLYGKNIKSIFWHFRSKVHIIDWMYCDIIGELSVRSIRIDLWHGMPLKNFGYLEKNAVVDNYYRFVKEGCWRKKYLLTTSELSKELLSAARGVSKDKCLIASYPRNNKLYNSKSRKLTDNEECRVFYLPTFRDNDIINPILNEDLNIVNEMLKNNNIAFYIKPHFASMAEWNAKGTFSNIKVLDAKEDVYDFLCNTDILVTDYSSVYFDFLLTKRPVVFFSYDYEYYSNDDRGFALPYERYTPGAKVYKPMELFEKLVYIRNNYSEYMETYFEQYKKVNNDVNLYTEKANYDELLQFWKK
ncbi:MAG: CDP-glycerol glycerophosphotransferase family protein [Lachnospiraceae bacterium]|nr:CDP-glycerol glycerophosphotransferase family protein [Lachnospiraceae bacterium]